MTSLHIGKALIAQRPREDLSGGGGAEVKEEVLYLFLSVEILL